MVFLHKNTGYQVIIHTCRIRDAEATAMWLAEIQTGGRAETQPVRTVHMRRESCLGIFGRGK